MIQLLLLTAAVSTVFGQGDVCNVSLTSGLPDSSFTASSEYTTKDPQHLYAPYLSKLFTKVDPDKTAYKTGGWVALSLDKKQWLQMDLTQPSLLKSVTTQGRDLDPDNGCCEQWVTKYTLEYSMDGQKWTSVKDTTGADRVFDGNTDTNTPVTNSLNCPIIAQYVRVRPTEWHKHIAMRVGVNGCYTTSTPKQNSSTATTTAMPTTLSTLLAGALSTGQCVSDCSGKPDGFYPSCNGCDLYVKCYQHQLTDNNPCPKGTLWNDNAKFCDTSSPTCKGSTTTQGTTVSTKKPGQLSTGQCVPDCGVMGDGYYQSCLGCDFYVHCVSGQKTDGLPCPPGTFWNDNAKFCDVTSPTCHGSVPTMPLGFTTPTTSTPTTSTTTTSTTTTPTTTTTTQTTTPTTTTPTTTTTTTTIPTTTTTATTTTPTTTTTTTTIPTTTTTATTTTPTTPTPSTATILKTTYKPGILKPSMNRCVSDCSGLPNGDYQSCIGCNYIITCASGLNYDGKKCPGNTLWNDDIRRCDYTSPTCP